MGSMYEPFRTTKRKGNGLGLLIVRRIIKDHGGTLAFASKEGTGTTVTLTLPRADRVVRLLPA
jgi:signal transduction histidine kinase